MGWDAVGSVDAAWPVDDGDAWRSAPASRIVVHLAGVHRAATGWGVGVLVVASATASLGVGVPVAA